MLAHPTAVQREVLGAIPYSRNHALLHTDERLLPRSPRARALWNYQRRKGRDGVLVTYDLTRLMRLADTDRHYLVTLGGEDIVDPDTVLAERHYAHPIYTSDSVAAQTRLGELDVQQIALTKVAGRRYRSLEVARGR